MSTPLPPANRVELTVSWATLFKLLAFATVALALVKLWGLVGMVLLAIFLAITMAPISGAIQKRGGPKWLAVTACALLLLGTVGAFLFFVTPLAAAQMGGLIKGLPTFKDFVAAKLPSSGPFRDLVEGMLQSPTLSNPGPLLQRFFDYGAIALEWVLQFFVVLIIAIYLLADGRRVYDWLLAFLPERHQARMAKAAPEFERVIFSYMGGQLVTSLLCAIYTFTVLTILHIPNALLLAIMAGLFDILPIIGFLLSLVPAVAIAFTISPTAAWLVAALYVAYHLIENYLIVPRIYGNRLRLSGLTVLLCCLAAGLLAGAVGIILVLPIIACYPIVERTWLRPVVGTDTVAEHEKIDAKEHAAPPPTRARRATHRVRRGNGK